MDLWPRDSSRVSLLRKEDLVQRNQSCSGLRDAFCVIRVDVERFQCWRGTRLALPFDHETMLRGPVLFGLQY